MLPIHIHLFQKFLITTHWIFHFESATKHARTNVISPKKCHHKYFSNKLELNVSKSFTTHTFLSTKAVVSFNNVSVWVLINPDKREESLYRERKCRIGRCKVHSGWPVRLRGSANPEWATRTVALGTTSTNGGEAEEEVWWHLLQKHHPSNGQALKR